MSFGVTKDYWGLADSHWKPQAGNKAPTAAGEAQAEDSHGDLRASTVHGHAGAWTVPYDVIGGDSGLHFSVNTHVKLGQIVAVDSVVKGVITTVEVATTNKTFPRVTVGGVQFFGDSLSQLEYSIPTPAALHAHKRAQAMGVVVAADNRLNSCTLSASLQVIQVADSLGVYVQTEAYQGRAEVTAEAVHATADPAITADSGWAVSKNQDIATSNTEYGKGTLNVFKNILPDS